MDEFQESTQHISDLLSSYRGFEIVTVEDYDFQVKCRDDDYVVKIDSFGEDKNGRGIEVYRGTYAEMGTALFKGDPLISITGFDEEALAGALAGAISHF